jgi:soluble lytic murein transglycosylase-like protein
VSSQAIAPAPVGVPAGELAVAQRVAQLQAMIEQTRGAISGAGAAASSSASFSQALQAATAGSAAPIAYQAQATGGSSQSTPYDALIEQAAARNGLDPAILHGLIQQESGFDPNSQSSAGAAGLTQLMPGTASSLGVANPLDPAESIEGGARYLSRLMTQFGGNTTDALAAYNAGPGAVQRYGGVPPYAETQSYVSKVLGYAEAFRQAPPATSAGSVA